MILHAVMLRLAPRHDPAELEAVMTGLSALVDQVEGFLALDYGPNLDIESLSPGFCYGFVCRFADLTALDRYAQDDRHIALGTRLVALCEADGIMVFDIDTSGCAAP